MANSTVAALPSMGALDGSELLYVIQAGADKKGTPAAVASILLGLANTWTHGQTITPAANESGLVVSGYSLTGANAQSLLDLSGTWNTTGTPTGLKFNITDTASNAASLLLDLQKGAVSQLAVNKNGALLFGSTSNAILLTGGLVGIGSTVNTILAVGVSSGNYVGMQNLTKFGFTNGGGNNGNIDTPAFRDAAGVWGFRNGTSAEAIRVYGTFTDASNNTWAGIDYQTTAGTPRLRAVAVGTGVAAPLAIDAYQKAGAAVASDIPAGTWALIRDTSGSTTKLVYNNAGTLQTVTLT